MYLTRGIVGHGRLWSTGSAVVSMREESGGPGLAWFGGHFRIWIGAMAGYPVVVQDDSTREKAQDSDGREGRERRETQT